MILLRMRFVVPAQWQRDFIDVCVNVYLPALSKQEGFVDARLLRPYSTEELLAMGTDNEGYDYDLEFSFESEKARLAWVASADHAGALAAAAATAQSYRFCGYSVVASTQVAGIEQPTRTEEP